MTNPTFDISRGLRRMRGRDTGEHHRVASSLELLFDLVFVVAFGVAGSELAHAIALGHWAAGIGGFSFALGAIIWAWINYTWFASAFDTDDWLYRVLTMLQMTGVIVLAIGLPPMFESIDHGGHFASETMVVGYMIMRIAMIAQWLRATRDERYRSTARTYLIFISVAQVVWVLVAFVPMDLLTTLAVAALAWAIELCGPIIAERRGARTGAATPWHPHHMAERYQLLAIVALGETVLGTLSAAQAISAADGWTFDTIVVIGAGIAMSFALWWSYFSLPSAEVLEQHRDRSFVWGYGHAFIFASIAAVGAGLHVIGYLYDDHYETGILAATLSLAVPVLVFVIALFLIHSWLLHRWMRGIPTQAIALVLPIVAIVLASAGQPMWVCLLVVLGSPVAIVVSIETGRARAAERAVTVAEKSAH